MYHIESLNINFTRGMFWTLLLNMLIIAVGSSTSHDILLTLKGASSQIYDLSSCVHI